MVLLKNSPPPRGKPEAVPSRDVNHRRARGRDSPGNSSSSLSNSPGKNGSKLKRGSQSATGSSR